MNDDMSPDLLITYPPEPPRRRIRAPRLSVATLVILALAGVGFVLATNLPATLAAARTGSAAATTGATGPHGGHPRGGPGGDLTVSSVSGSDVKATDHSGATVTVHTSSTTTFRRAGATSSLSALKAGTAIEVRGTRNSDGTITAAEVDIVLPRYMGTVTKISGNTITVQSPHNSATQTITVSSSTTYTRAGQSASLSDVQVGSAISAEGTVASDNSLTAEQVEIQVPHVDGQIVSVSGSTLTLRDDEDGTLTVRTTSSTTAASVSMSASGPTKTTIAVSSLKAGDYIAVEGTRNSDGSLTALTVTQMPSGGPGHMDAGGPDFGGHGGPGDPNGPTPSE